MPKPPDACGLQRIVNVCVVFVLSIALWLPAMPASSQPGAPLTVILRGDETPEAVRKLVETLAAGGRTVEIRLADAAGPSSSASGAAPQAKAPTMQVPTNITSSRLDTLWGSFWAGFDHGNAAIPHLMELPGDWSRAWARTVSGTAEFSAGLRVLMSLVLALCAAFLFRRATVPWFARRLQPAGPASSQRLSASAYGLMQDLACIALALGVARIAQSLTLPADDLARFTAGIVTNGSAIGATYIAFGRFLLGPDAPERRLMPLPRAERHFLILTIYAVLTPLVVSSALLAQHVASGPQATAGLIAITGLAMMLFKVWWFFDARYDLKALILNSREAPGFGLRVLATVAPWFYIACAIGIWAVGRAAPMMDNGGRLAEAAELTQLIIILVPIIAIGATGLLASRQAHRAVLAAPPPIDRAVGHAVRAAVGGLVWAVGLYGLARMWAGFLLGLSPADFAAFSREVASLAAIAFCGWVGLVFLRGFFDAYSPKTVAILPGDEDAAHEESIPSRLATVLPVVRGVILTAVIGLTGLVVLSRLGVDIGPLLAGFGILGLAISFGSQALVRDIVSGFFFMLEDAFRVGEYVDTGRLKGTVEKISLRSMQLRHQSGQIHTVPFGQISSLTNSSRDWATVKFNIRLDHTADIEQARKTIKKTGLALLDDPEFGPHFIAPLKMQGVADITDSAVVIRLKLTAKPNQASGVQREALKRIYRALNEAKVPFASTAVTVRGGDSAAQSNAAAAIATLPAPVPATDPR